MARENPSLIDLTQIVARYPRDGLLIQWLSQRDAEFADLCVDHALACECLARFKGMPDGHQRPEVADYQAVIARLESEVLTFLTRSRRASAKGYPNV